MSRQPTLGKFGFKKSIEHRGSKSTVQLPDFMAKKAKTFECKKRRKQKEKVTKRRR
jgi:hypothetical protein